jgi:glycosyltransferase involved in cell wall biosynthesis
LNFALVLTNLLGGGAERAMLRLAAALQRRGHRAEVIVLEPRIEHEVPANVTVHALDSSRGWPGRWLAARELRALYRRLGLSADCLTVSTLPFADQVAVWARLPNLWCRISNTLSAEIEQLRRSSPDKAGRRRIRYRHLYEGRDLIAVSEGVATDLRHGLGLERARIVRVYNGFDVEAMRAAAAQPDPDLPREPFVLHVGRFMPQKRHDLLFEAWKRAALPHQLVLLTPPSAELDALIAAHGLESRVRVAGFKPNPYPWMRATELLVLSSEREGLPNVLVEALACGTRVVSTDCPSGPREVMRGELARWLVPPGDAQGLADAMRAALGGPRPAAGTLPHEFCEEGMARAYEELAAANAVHGGK